MSRIARTRHATAVSRAAPLGSPLTGGVLTGGALTGGALTGSRLIGSRLIGSRLTGCQCTGSLLMASLLMASLLMGLAGCDRSDRTGVWHPRGANAGNLAAQVTDPNDLVRGKETSSSDGVLAAAAIDRLHAGKVKELPTGSFAAAPTASASSSSGGGSGSSEGSN